MGLDMSVHKPSEAKNMTRNLCVGVQVVCRTLTEVRMKTKTETRLLVDLGRAAASFQLSARLLISC